jgi:hypothetical protein
VAEVQLVTEIEILVDPVVELHLLSENCAAELRCATDLLLERHIAVALWVVSLVSMATRGWPRYWLYAA